MSETPANQFGISTDLPSLSVTVRPSVSIYFCRCSFVFCQLGAAVSLPGNDNEKRSDLKCWYYHLKIRFFFSFFNWPEVAFDFD